METTQAQAQATEPRERLLKARTPETYSGKSHMDCYHFCQQCEDYFETSGATGMNRTLFAATFLRGPISLRWAQHKQYHEHFTLITWSEFKAFLWKNFESSQAFIDSIWSKFRRNSQYQLEEARDWAFYLQHLQSILSEFDLIRTPNKLTMICYFRKDLKPFIKTEMEQQDRESMDFKEMVQKTLNTEAKASLKSSTMVRNLDTRCSKGHRLSHNTSSKVQTQGSKDSSHSEEPKPKDLKPTPSRDNAAEPAKKENKKDKKKKLQNQRRKK